ncbi:cupredoxin domain-containing protein [Aliiglaciecola litoralis]|uniref:EfeO-type cupredoxin-like domain-containing protein n=1 Tax=Aliiglaciecola litoralis TaxID=582857 RepID=A0ABP3WQR8_9ALTE
MFTVTKNSVQSSLSKTSYVAIAIFCATLSFITHGIQNINVTIKENLFYPAEVIIPAYRKVKITFINQDDTPEEIDSFDLNREKVVFANSSAHIFIGPLKPGKYRFFGEYHPNSAVGFVHVVDGSEIPDAD